MDMAASATAHSGSLAAGSARRCTQSTMAPLACHSQRAMCHISRCPGIASPCHAARVLSGFAAPPLARRRSTFAVKAEISSTDVDVDAASSPPPLATGEGLKRTPELEEKYAVVDSGKWACNSCGYTYDQSVGDPSYPISPGLEFKQLPEDWVCPTCGATQSNFSSLGRQVAGFVQNQQYGLGTNSMTAAQKGLAIWGSLAFFFLLFLSGYFFQ